MRLQETLSELIKNKRLELKGASFSAIAREIGLKQSTLYRICHGETENPTRDTVRLITKYFRVSVEELFGETPLPDDLEQSREPSLSIEQRAYKLSAAIHNMLEASGFPPETFGSPNQVAERLVEYAASAQTHTNTGDSEQNSNENNMENSGSSLPSPPRRYRSRPGTGKDAKKNPSRKAGGG